ncbi:MAG: phosphoribosylformylglycinamidine synthase, partial [Wenzhouxiangella sp.]|nr:phosphoribosylformylglycinamidine synthase [Wenzhouxiangella sp.]
MIFLLGPDSLPSFQQQALAEQVSVLEARAIELAARDVFLIDAEDIEPDDFNRLRQLLHAEPWVDDAPTDPCLIIAPRPGTRTPWASKAADILRRCGLAHLATIERGRVFEVSGVPAASLSLASRQILHDRMTEVVLSSRDQLADWFAVPEPGSLAQIELGSDPVAALTASNQTLGLALSDGEIEYLAHAYDELGRDPTDAELMMFAQANSEHCRHKIFNASWTVDEVPAEVSLFGLIRRTHAKNPMGTLVAYDDNAAILEGFAGRMLVTDVDNAAYRSEPCDIHLQIKVETHNHPTAISPDPGAATGAGGEIRDETATGRGGRPVAALTGFSVSDLCFPDARQPWELAPSAPDRLASSLEIMRDGPIGAARFNNEFGRPALLGYFRTLSTQAGGQWWGYHKPIMLAGGSGMIAGGQTEKKKLRPGDRIIVLGGPAMLIGLGGGAASSMSSGQSDADLDYASVQRGNPEMQRRCQEVIDRCWSLAEKNPIRSIHDVGAGGLSNALPELLHDGGVGGQLNLRAIPSADPGLSPMAIWCNEAQERYVLAIAPEDGDQFAALCERERCPWADLGPAADDGHLRVDDPLLGQPVVDMDLELLLGKPPSMHRDAVTETIPTEELPRIDIDLREACERVLALPAVGSKQFLITIGDRSVGGLSVRDQMVGPWQVPVADQAISLTDYEGFTGSAMSVGERTPLAIWDSAAAARMAVGEALTNLASVCVPGIERIKLSANWMAAAGTPGQDAALRRAVEAVSEFCCRIGLAIPVGKDSLSMQTVWQEGESEQRMRAPVSLIVSAFAPVEDVRLHLTPQLQPVPSRLILIDLGQQRLGGSALSQVFSSSLGPVPDNDDPALLRRSFDALQSLIQDGQILACHDRSDGGLFVCALEMALAGRIGIGLQLERQDLLAELFNEELGWLLQVSERDWPAVERRLADAGLGDHVHIVGELIDAKRLEVRHQGETQFSRCLGELAQAWSQTSYRMQRLRDHPSCADEEFAALADLDRPGLQPKLVFDLDRPPVMTGRAKPRVAILREQGVNGQREMARAFMGAGFEAVDVHMSDLETGRQTLDRFQGLVACGGFSFGDVLGAGQGWARSILFNAALADQFEAFFADPTRFALGVCNGCQMLSALKSIIPGAEDWPAFVHNRSRQFEARLSQVRIEASPSLFFRGMVGSRLPIVTAHGEGRARFGGDRVPEEVV